MSKNFLDRFKKQSASSNNNNNNPLAGWFGISNNNTSKSFGGTGQSLGGSQPGQVIPVELSEPGPLGIHVEKRPDKATAVVQQVVPGSQAERAGLQRGDVLCFADSNGQEEILYDLFLELAKNSHHRPLCFEVRRVPKTTTSSSAAAVAGAASAKQQANTKTTTSKSAPSADAYARRQAVIAAAEQREREHKKKIKPICKKDPASGRILVSTAERQQIEARRQQRLEEQSSAAMLSEATRAAREAAKMAEQQTAAALGYNPYETKSLSAGQARTAVVSAAASTHGNRTVPHDTNNHNNSNQHASSSPGRSIPSVASPPQPAGALLPSAEVELPDEFQQAFETLVTSSIDHSIVMNSLSVLRKLIVNATTKGQERAIHDNNNNDTAAKFRKVRLANPKIAAAVTNVVGAVDLLLSVGFVLLHDDETNESLLVYPRWDETTSTSAATPSWLSTALQQMERYQ